MNIKIVNNKYINAVFLFLLFSATVHALILLISAAISGNLHILNYFNILGLNYFIPAFLNGLPGDIVSFILALIIYLVILKK